MLRRIARVIATSLLVATSFVQTSHAAGTTLFANVRVWPLVETQSPDPLHPSDTPNLIGFNPTESAEDPYGATGHVARLAPTATLPSRSAPSPCWPESGTS
jgi:hypothetical protein